MLTTFVPSDIDMIAVTCKKEKRIRAMLQTATYLLVRISALATFSALHFYFYLLRYSTAIPLQETYLFAYHCYPTAASQILQNSQKKSESGFEILRIPLRNYLYYLYFFQLLLLCISDTAVEFEFNCSALCWSARLLLPDITLQKLYLCELEPLIFIVL